MFANSQEGAVAPGRGFAARAARRTDAGSGLQTRRGEHPGREDAEAYERSGARPRGGPASRTVAMPSVAPSSGDPRRVKRLAAVAAASVAVALASVVYGAWSSTSSQAAVETATAGALPTLVAAADIHAGEELSSAALETKSVPATYRQESALGEESLAEGALSGSRALVDIPAGTQITPSLVTGVGGSGRLSADIGAGLEAVTVSVDTETGIAGRIEAFDLVRAVSAESAASGETLLRTLCDRARVVAVGGGQGDEGSAGSVTLEVTPDEADAVREAQYAGRVSLVLISAADAVGEEGDRG